MKRKVITLCIITGLMLSGCGSNEKVITGNSSGNAISVENDDAGKNENVEKDNKDDASTKGFLFKTKDVSIAINGEAEGYIQALGDPVSYYESPSCAFGDLDKVYTYNGFEIDTYSIDGKDYISAVILYDDTVSTEEGVCIGDTADKVREIYGSPDTEKDNGILFLKDDMKLCFIIQDNSVTSIQYLNTILD